MRQEKLTKKKKGNLDAIRPSLAKSKLRGMKKNYGILCVLDA